MFKRLIAAWLLVCLWCVWTSPAAAQDKLTEKFISYDSWLAFNYPSGWSIDSDSDDFGSGLIMLASSSKAMQTMRQNSNSTQVKSLGSGEIGMFVLRSRYLNDLLALTPQTKPGEVIEQFLGAGLELISSEIQPLTIGGYAAARLDSADEKSAGMFLAVDFGFNQRILIVASTNPADFERYESVVLEIGESLKFGGEAQKLLIHDNPVWQIAWSPDGRYFGTRETNPETKANTVHVWTADDLSEAYQIAGDGFEWSPDGRRLLTWEVNGVTRVWDSASGDLVADMPRASRAEWSADGTRILLTSFQDSKVAVYDAEKDALVSSVYIKTSFAHWANNDTAIMTVIAGLSDQWLTQLWDAATGEEILNVSDTNSLSWNSDRTRIAAPLRSGNIDIYDLSTRSVILSIPVKLDRDLFGLYIHDLQWLVDDTLITANVGSCAANGRNCTLDLWVWNAETGELVKRFAKDEPFRYAAWNPDEQRVLTLSRQPHRALLWDVTSDEVVQTIELPDFGQGVLWNKDGSKVLVWSDEGMVRLWNTKTNKVLVTLPHDTEIDSVRWSKDEKFIYTRTINGMLRTWDALTGRILLQIGSGGKGDRDVAAWRAESPDGKQLVTWVSGAPGVRVWNNEEILFFAQVKYESDPLLTGDYFDQSTEAVNNGEYEKALAILKHIETLDPDLPRIFNDRGVVYFRMDNARLAVDEITRAIHIDPNYVDAYLNRAGILRRLQLWGEALEDYSKAIELDPTRPNSYNARGVTYSNRSVDDYPAAIDDFTKAIELRPDYALAYQNRGFIAYQMKNYEASLKDYREYVRLVGDKVDKDTLDIIAKLEALTN